MRKRVVCICALGCFGYAVACGGDDDSSSSDVSDAGSDSSFDSSPTDGSPPSDAGDAAVDTRVIVTATSFSAPLPGAIVVFYMPDGTAQAPLTTGADGQAALQVPSGSSVTVSVPLPLGATETDYDLTTFLKVEPGDRLTVQAEIDSKLAASKAKTMTMTATSAVNDASTYVFANGCGAYTSSGPSAVVGVTDRCLEAGTLDVLGVAQGDQFEALASSQEVGATFVDGGTLTGFAWSPVTPTTLGVTGAPTAPAVAFIFNVDLFKGSSFYETRFGQSVTFPTTFTPEPLTIPSGTFLTTGVSTAQLAYVGTALSNSSVKQYTQTPLASGFTVDFASMPPEISDPLMTTDGSGAVTLAVTAAGAVTSLAGFVGDITFDATPATADAGITNPARWHVVAPPGVSFALPKLTKDLIPAFPTTATSVLVAMRSGTPYADYRAFRRAYPAVAGGGIAATSYRVNETSTETK